MRTEYKEHRIEIVKNKKGKFNLFIGEGLCEDEFDSEAAALALAREEIDGRIEDMEEREEEEEY